MKGKAMRTNQKQVLTGPLVDALVAAMAKAERLDQLQRNYDAAAAAVGHRVPRSTRVKAICARSLTADAKVIKQLVDFIGSGRYDRVPAVLIASGLAERDHTPDVHPALVLTEAKINLLALWLGHVRTGSTTDPYLAADRAAKVAVETGTETDTEVVMAFDHLLGQLVGTTKAA
jgi:hypothetical protein